MDYLKLWNLHIVMLLFSIALSSCNSTATKHIPQSNYQSKKNSCINKNTIVRANDQIQLVFHRTKKILITVYKSVLRKNPELKGNIDLKIRVDKTGYVESITVHRTDIEDSHFIKKIISAVQRFNFGCSDEKFTFIYPLDFIP